MLKSTIISISLMISTLPALAAETIADAGITCDEALTHAPWYLDCETRHATIDRPWGTRDAPAATMTSLDQHPPTTGVFMLGDSLAHRAMTFLHDVIDLGTEGAFTVPGILAQARSVPINAHTVVIEGGINDLHLTPGITPQSVAAGYARILAALPSGAHIDIVGVLPVYPPLEALAIPPGVPQVPNATIARTNTAIAQGCAGKCTFIGNPFGTSLQPQMQDGSGVHLSREGNVIWADSIGRVTKKQ